MKRKSKSAQKKKSGQLSPGMDAERDTVRLGGNGTGSRAMSREVFDSIMNAREFSDRVVKSLRVPIHAKMTPDEVKAAVKRGSIENQGNCDPVDARVD